MIKFKHDTELAIVTDFDERTDTITGQTVQRFPPNELVDAEIVSVNDDNSNYVDLQFGGSGGVAFGVQKDCFETA